MPESKHKFKKNIARKDVNKGNLHPLRMAFNLQI